MTVADACLITVAQYNAPSPPVGITTIHPPRIVANETSAALARAAG